MSLHGFGACCVALHCGALLTALPASAQSSADDLRPIATQGDAGSNRPARVLWELADPHRIASPISFPLTLRVGKQSRELSAGASAVFEVMAPASGYVLTRFDGEPIWLPVHSGRETIVGRSACCVLAWRDPFETNPEVASCSVGPEGRVCDPESTAAQCACPEGTHQMSPGLASDRICGRARRCLRTPRLRVLGNRRIAIWLGHPTSATEVDVEPDPADAEDVIVRPGPDRLVHVFREEPELGESEAIAALAIPVGQCAWIRMADDDVEAVFAAGSTRPQPGEPVGCGTPWDAAVERAARCAGAPGCRSSELRGALELCVAATGDPLWPECASLVAQLVSPARSVEPELAPNAVP